VTELTQRGELAVAEVPVALRPYTRDLFRWREGNHIELLRAGKEAFPAMLAAIAGAQREILLETYIFEDDRTGRTFAEALAERARAGVTVRLIYDAVGSWGMASTFVDDLRRAGVQVLEFHPIAPWRRRFNLSKRDHRKILVVDDDVAFIGGLNISDDYADPSAGGRGWHDLHCELHGPIVFDLSRLFRKTWLYCHGAPYPSPVPPAPSNKPGALMCLRDNGQIRLRRSIRRAYMTGFRAAQQRILVENAYFLPDFGMRSLLRRAVRRGVDVRVIVPGRSDVALVELAGLYVYRRLAHAGVKILRWQGVMMHSKAAVIDGVWSVIGSYNLDHRSLGYNLEAVVEILDSSHGAVMETQFAQDQAATVPFDEKAWTELPWWRKVAAWGAFQLYRWL
jgi:cardiolipin synthase